METAANPNRRRYHDRMHHGIPSRLGAWKEALWFVREHRPWKRTTHSAPAPLTTRARHSNPREQVAQTVQSVHARPRPVLPGQVAVTWIGHASLLVQIGGKNLLTDPVW